MFTGLVQSVGTVLAAQGTTTGSELCITHALGELGVGESIAVNGCCLTVVKAQNNTRDPSAPAARFWADVTHDSLARTTLGQLRTSQRVNLERSLCVGDLLGGHLVTGHVDAVARVLEVERLGEDRRVLFEMPRRLYPMLAPRGSVTIDGVSLTLGDVVRSSFGVTLIPHTQHVTTLKELRSGSQVNVEVDVIARYVAHALGTTRESQELEPTEDSPLMTTLKKAGLL